MKDPFTLWILIILAGIGALFVITILKITFKINREKERRDHYKKNRRANEKTDLYATAAINATTILAAATKQ